MKTKTINPSRIRVKQSRVNKIWSHWLKRGKKLGITNLQELNEKHSHIFDRRMIQSCAGLTLKNMNVPEKNKRRVMQLTQELYNLGVLEEVIYFSEKEMLSRKHLPMKSTPYLRVVNIIDELNQHLGHLERTEHYFARLNETLVENYNQND